jgi:PKD repeat protein
MENSTDIAYDQSLFANGFEECIHFYPGLASVSLEEAKATIDSQIASAEATFGMTPASWSCHGNQDNVTHAIYAYNKYGSLYRNGPMGMAFITNVDTLSNATWAWWSVSSARGAVSPCFTHRTDEYPAISYSIDPDLFRNFVTNLNSNGINLVHFSKWYYSSMAQNSTTDILQYDADYIEFQLNTSAGYPVNMNMQTEISPSYLYCNGVSIPFNQTSDGIQFMSVGNGTYTLTKYALMPSADFTANKTEGIVPLTVKFTDTSTNNPTSWEWNFRDGNTSTERNPEHTFSSEGIYNVTLVATNASNSSVLSPTDIKSKNITVKGLPAPPVANFTANKTEGTAPLTVKFTDTSTNSPIRWEWSFGDGATSTDANPIHVYATARTYVVNLTVSNEGGTDTESKTINVTGPVMGSPKASFTAVPQMGSVPLTVKFTDKSVNATSITWDFGDKSGISTELNPSHIYRTTGFYTVKLTATNGNKSSVASKMIIAGS